MKNLVFILSLITVAAQASANADMSSNLAVIQSVKEQFKSGKVFEKTPVGSFDCVSHHVSRTEPDSFTLRIESDKIIVSVGSHSESLPVDDRLISSAGLVQHHLRTILRHDENLLIAETSYEPSYYEHDTQVASPPYSALFEKNALDSYSVCTPIQQSM